MTGPQQSPEPPRDGRDEAHREQALRRLLAQAVEPVQPQPGAEARLRARIRGQEQQRRPHRTRLLGWGATAIGSAAVVLVAVVLVVNGTGRSGSGDSASSAGSAASAASSPAPGDGSATAAPAAPSAAAADGGAAQGTGRESRPAPTPGVALSTATGSGTLRFSATPVPTLSLPQAAGSPSVTLPPAGPGAGIRAVTQLPDASGRPVPVAVVRLTAGGQGSVDVLVSLAAGRLTLLTYDGRPLQLRADATHGYACGGNGLALAGRQAPLVVEGAALVPSPRLVAERVPAGRAGCLG